MRECTKDIFLKDVENHTMTVYLDNGIHRHLRFSHNNSFNMYFEITTWPGYLCISGDMGCYVFARLEDMFQFFRHDDLKINLEYWHEKLEAVGRHTKSKRYSPDKFIKKVNYIIDEFIEDEECDEDQAKELRDEIKEEVLCYADDSEEEARQALNDFEYTINGFDDDIGGERTFKFYDTWEWSLEDYTYHYVWCCYAIAWAIQQYDLEKGKCCERDHNADGNCDRHSAPGVIRVSYERS